MGISNQSGKTESSGRGRKKKLHCEEEMIFEFGFLWLSGLKLWKIEIVRRVKSTPKMETFSCEREQNDRCPAELPVRKEAFLSSHISILGTRVRISETASIILGKNH